MHGRRQSGMIELSVTRFLARFQVASGCDNRIVWRLIIMNTYTTK